MRKSAIISSMLLLFIIEGTWMNWLIPAAWQTGVIVSPHLVMIVIIFIGIYWDPRAGLLFGLGFGLLHDIVFYGPMIGTYCMGFGLVGYAAGLFPFRSQSNILTTLFIVAIGEFSFEWLIYGIYRLMAVVQTSPQRIFLFHIMPSILINLFVALILYIPLRRLFERARMPLMVEEQE
ncbi:MAG: rod shape-determining protein MreD [Gorillibacterium sp.]|nr:rod shape-determining protein MreD [Gorillibacterium sp.]